MPMPMSTATAEPAVYVGEELGKCALDVGHLLRPVGLACRDEDLLSMTQFQIHSYCTAGNFAAIVVGIIEGKNI